MTTVDRKLRVMIETLYNNQGAKAAAAGLDKLGGAAGRSEQAARKNSTAWETFTGVLTGNLVTGALTTAKNALVGFAQSSIAMASDTFEAASKFEYVFGDAAGKTEQALNDFAESAQRSRFQLKDMSAEIGAILSPMLGSADAAGAMSVEFAKLAVDLASFMNVSEGDAMGAIISGMIGETEPMRRFGVLLSAARVEQEIFTQGWAATKGEITDAMKIQARYNIIVRDTQNAQGDAIRTADSYANKQRELDARMEELQVTVGTALLPLMVEWTDTMAGAAVVITDRLSPALQGIGGEMGNTVSEMADGFIRSKEGVNELAEAAAVLAEKAEMSRGFLGRFTGTTDELNAALLESVIQAAEAAGGFDEFESAIADAFGSTDEFNDEIGRGGLAARKYAEVVAKIPFDEWKDQQYATYRNLDLTTEQVYELAQAMAEDRERENYVNSMERIYEAAGVTTDGLKDLTEATREQKLARLAAMDASHNYADTEYEVEYAAYAANKAIEDQVTAARENSEAIAAAREAAAEYRIAMEELTTSAFVSSLEDQNAAFAAGKQYTVDWKDELFNVAGTMDLTAVQMSELALATGDYSEAQIEAALKAAAMKLAVQELAEQIANNEITVSEAVTELENFETSLEGTGTAADTLSGQLLIGAERAEALRQGLEGISGEYLATLTIQGLEQLNMVQTGLGIANQIAQNAANNTTNNVNVTVPPGSDSTIPRQTASEVADALGAR